MRQVDRLGQEQPLVLCELAEVGELFLQERPELDAGTMNVEILGLDLRDVEDAVHGVEKSLGASPYRLDELLLVLGAEIVQSLFDHLVVAEDHVERGADL